MTEFKKYFDNYIEFNFPHRTGAFTEDDIEKAFTDGWKSRQEIDAQIVRNEKIQVLNLKADKFHNYICEMMAIAIEKQK
jgi:hypothetical protein